MEQPEKRFTGSIRNLMGRAGLWQHRVPTLMQRETVGSRQRSCSGDSCRGCSGVSAAHEVVKGTLDVCNGKCVHKERTMKMKAGEKSREGC